MSAAIHVIDEYGCAGQPVGLHVIAREIASTGGRALLVGPSALGRHAVAAGLAGWRRIPGPRPLPIVRHLALRRALSGKATPPAVHCWSDDLLSPINRLLRRTGVRVVHRRLTADLTIDPSLRERDRLAIRQSWRAQDRTRVVALLTDHPALGDAYDAAMVVGLCREAMRARDPGADILLLLHPDQRHAGAAHRLFANFDAPGVARQDPRLDTPWAVLTGCDAVLALGCGPAVAARWAVEAHVPVVAEQHPGITRLVNHQPGADIRLAPPGDLRTLSHQLTQTLAVPAPVPAA